MSKININPVKVEAPATPGGYMTPGEIKANIQELENIERMIKRRESRFADMTDEQILDEKDFEIATLKKNLDNGCPLKCSINRPEK